MLFNSSLFIGFFIVTVLLYFLSPHRFRWIILLVAGYIFYAAWNPPFLLLMLFSVFVNYSASFFIHKAGDNLKKRKIIFIVSLVISFGVLFVFKYLGFVNQSLSSLFAAFGFNYLAPTFSIILPLGISFFTFQAVGYTIDVYRKQTEPEKNFFKFSLFITFFPQLVAGPIERYTDLMPQLFTEKKFSVDNLVIGLKFMVFGFFKKIVVADRIAVAVNTVFNSPSSFGGLSYIIASVLFAFQIYCDFGGYSDIAIGCAKILDINLMQNFRQPFFSKGIREFWQRWHISLSFWFRDYLYIPLGGNRCSRARKFYNLFVTFVISGIWHGANWTFVLWGALHGFYQIIGNLTHKARKKAATLLKIDNLFITKALRVLITFCLATFAFIFFRANSISDAFYIIGHMFSDAGELTDAQYVYQTLNSFGFTFFELVASVCFIIFLSVADGISGKENIHVVLERKPFALRFAFYTFIMVSILAMGVFSNASDFIYFQF